MWQEIDTKLVFTRLSDWTSGALGLPETIKGHESLQTNSRLPLFAKGGLEYGACCWLFLLLALLWPCH